MSDVRLETIHRFVIQPIILRTTRRLEQAELRGSIELNWAGKSCNLFTPPSILSKTAAQNESRHDGLSSPPCYRAGVEVCRRQHPDQTAESNAKQAVAVILAAHAKIRIEE
jgi:hypothetical protein